MKDLSLYIHIPFCRSRCTYCGFITYADKDRLIEECVKALIREINHRSKSFKKHRVVSVYFGGGTPSHINHLLIKEIITALKRGFQICKDAEITIESNPESLCENKIIHYRKYGINRLSIGIQSLNDRTLKKIGRTHNRRQALKAVELAKKHFSNLSLDFIIGLPFQTASNFAAQLDQIMELKPTHFSFYFLSPDNPKINAFLRECPQENEQIKIYDLITKRLSQEGFNQYEVSNYAKTGYECKHNLRYWEQKEYLGVGLAAHSFLNDTVYENEKSLNRYINNPLARENALHLDSALKKMDYVMMHLRTNKGINKTEFKKKFGDINQLLQNAAPYIESKKLINNSTHIRISQKGALILDKIIDDLI